MATPIRPENQNLHQVLVGAGHLANDRLRADAVQIFLARQLDCRVLL